MHTCLSDGYGLLFHDFVDCDSIDFVHFIELVNANNSTVSQDHCTCFESLLSSILVGNDGGSQTDTTGSTACSSNCQFSRGQNPAENLTLSCTWVSHHQQVDVTSQMGSVLQILLLSSQQHQQHCLLQLVVAVDGRGYRSAAKSNDLGLIEGQFAGNRPDKHGLAEHLGRQTEEVGFEDTFFFALGSSDEFIDADHLNPISWLDSVHEIALHDHRHRLRKKSRRRHFREFLNDHSLDVTEGTHAILETERVVVVVVGLDEARFAGFELLLRVEVVGVLLDFVGLSLVAEVDALLELVLHDVHFGNNALNSDQLVRQFAPQPSRSDEIGAQVALETDAVVLQLALEPRLLLAHHPPLQEVFSETIILGGVLDEVGGGLGVGLAKEIEVDAESAGVGESLTRDEIVEKPLIVLYFQLHLWRNQQMIQISTLQAHIKHSAHFVLQSSITANSLHPHAHPPPHPHLSLIYICFGGQNGCCLGQARIASTSNVNIFLFCVFNHFSSRPVSGASLAYTDVCRKYKLLFISILKSSPSCGMKCTTMRTRLQRSILDSSILNRCLHIHIFSSYKGKLLLHRLKGCGWEENIMKDQRPILRENCFLRCLTVRCCGMSSRGCSCSLCLNLAREWILMRPFTSTKSSRPISSARQMLLWSSVWYTSATHCSMLFCSYSCADLSLFSCSREISSSSILSKGYCTKMILLVSPPPSMRTWQSWRKGESSLWSTSPLSRSSDSWWQIWSWWSSQIFKVTKQRSWFSRARTNLQSLSCLRWVISTKLSICRLTRIDSSMFKFSSISPLSLDMMETASNSCFFGAHSFPTFSVWVSFCSLLRLLAIWAELMLCEMLLLPNSSRRPGSSLSWLLQKPSSAPASLSFYSVLVLGRQSRVWLEKVRLLLWPVLEEKRQAKGCTQCREKWVRLVWLDCLPISTEGGDLSRVDSGSILAGLFLSHLLQSSARSPPPSPLPLPHRSLPAIQGGHGGQLKKAGVLAYFLEELLPMCNL